MITLIVVVANYDLGLAVPSLWLNFPNFLLHQAILSSETAFDSSYGNKEANCRWA